MIELSLADFSRAAELFSALDDHLAVPAVLRGSAAGRVYVNDPAQPRSALLWTGHRLYLAGDPCSAPFSADLRGWLQGELFAGSPNGEYGLYFTDGWAEALANTILPDQPPLPGQREYYALDTSGWQAAFALPEGLELRPVDAGLVAQTGLEGLDDLLEEMQSERVSLEDFLARSFGLALLDVQAGAGKLIGWCLSEYNLDGRCEVGIATHLDYRKRGLAAACGAAFVEQARARGIHTIGWHCWKWNSGSGATARRIGYRLVREYPSSFVIADPLVNLAVHGAICMDAGNYTAAEGWLARALRLGDGPWWVSYRAGQVAARLGQVDAAFAHLRRALALGLPERAMLENSEHLAGLRGDPRWAGLMEK